MGKNKLKKFGEMETFPNVFQYPFAELQKGPFPLKGKWNTEFFKNDNPIVLELGCGKGEYAVGMAKKFADRRQAVGAGRHRQRSVSPHEYRTNRLLL